MSNLRVYLLVLWTIYVINISTVNGGQCSYYFDESTGFPFATSICSNITITSSKTRSTEYQCGAVFATRVYKYVFYNSNCGGQPKTSELMKCSAPDCLCTSSGGKYCNKEKFRFNTDSDPSLCSIPTTGELSSQILTIITDTCINKRIFSKSSDGHLLINTYDNNGCTGDSISDVNQCYEYIAPTASPTSKPTTSPPTTSAFPTVAPLPTISPSPTISTTSTTPAPTVIKPTNKPTTGRIFPNKPTNKPTQRTWTTGTTSTTNGSESSSATFLQDYKGYFIVCIVGIMVIGTLCSICCMMRKYRKRQLNEIDADHARNLIENDAELKKEGIQNDNGAEHEVDEIEIPGKLIKGKDKKKSKKKRNKYINFNDPNGELNINYVAHNEVCGDDNDTDDGAVIDDDDIPAAAYSDFTNEQTEDNYDEEIEISEGNEGMMDDYDENNDNTEESDNMDKDQVEVEMEDVNEDKEEDEVNELSDKE